MGSQDKALDLSEMEKFFTRTGNKQQYFASVKLDGMSAELTYEAGKLVQVLTRGDGFIGVDITAVAQTIPNIPKQLDIKDETVIIRGEIMLTKASHQELNQQLETEGKDTFANTRNGAVAIVKTLKNRAYGKFLSFLAFDVAYA